MSLMEIPILYPDLMIVLQIPIVLSLLLAVYQVYTVFRISEFRFLSLGLLISLLYLLINLATQMFFKETRYFSIANILFDEISIFLYFLSIYMSTDEGRNEWIKKRPIGLYVFVFILFIIIKISGVINREGINTSTDKIPYFNMVCIPVSLLNMWIIYLIANLFKSITDKYKLNNILYYSTLGYSLIQILPIFQPNSFGLTKEIVDTFGFGTGFLFKCCILWGMQILIISLGKENTEKAKELVKLEKDLEHEEKFSKKLDDILGRTFHEISTPLRSIGSSLKVLNPEDLNETPTKFNLYKKYIESIYSSHNSIMAIISASIKIYENFSGQIFQNEIFQVPHENNTECISVNTLIHVAILRTKSITEENVEFYIDYSANCNISCNAGQIIQVFINLFKNSYEAFENNIGKISVKTRVEKTKSETGDTIKRVVIYVSDNGTGVNEDDREKIFTQGFTTKTIDGKGRGYGLFIAQDLVSNNNGIIELSKENNQGAMFILTFPHDEIKQK